MKAAIVIALALMLSGCGGIKRTWAIITGEGKNCVDGVTYLQFASGATVQLNREGKVVPCE